MIKIKLNGKKGVDYNAYVDSYFADFAMDGFPMFLGGKGQYDGKQIVLLDELASKPANTKVMVLDGKDFFYYFTGHTVSGTLKTVTLGTLGKSYNKKDGSFDTGKGGKIDNVSAVVEISGLKISNPKEVRGDLHDTVYGLMGGDYQRRQVGPLPAARLRQRTGTQGQGDEEERLLQGHRLQGQGRPRQGQRHPQRRASATTAQGRQGQGCLRLRHHARLRQRRQDQGLRSEGRHHQALGLVFTELSAGSLDGSAFTKGTAATTPTTASSTTRRAAPYLTTQTGAARGRRRAVRQCRQEGRPQRRRHLRFLSEREVEPP